MTSAERAGGAVETAEARPPASLELPGEQRSVPLARRFARSQLSEWGLEHLVDDALLVCSELVTNALMHGAPPVVLQLRQQSSGVRLEVHDSGVAGPAVAARHAMATQGRGIAMVEALTSNWGVEPTAHGKVVWAEIGVQSLPLVHGSPEALEAFWGGLDLADAGLPRDLPQDPVGELAAVHAKNSDTAAASRLRARVIVDHMFQFVALLTSDGVLIDVNVAALDAGGLAPADVVGRAFWDCAWWQVSRRTINQLKEAIVAAASGQDVRYDVDVWAGGAGSELVTIDFGCRPIYAADGSIPFLVAEGRDISEKKQAELQLADTVQRLADVNRQLTELDALRRDFIANVSHELRTPLTIIMAGTDRLLERADEEHARPHLVRMRDAGAVLLKRVNDLLSAAALEQRRPLRVSEVDLAALVRHVAAQYEGLTTDRGQRLVVESHESCAASIDGDLTESMLSNLVGNAVKFTPDGGTIRVTVTRWGERAIIEVADSGPGIPTGMRTSVLEPFRQVERSATRRHEGTGLGLAIAAQVARRHGGELVVADASEGGALIRVTLPLLPDGTSTGVAPAPEPSKALHADVSALRAELKRSSAPDRRWRNDGRPKVLVVDDNVDLGDYLVELLEPHYDVTLTRDGLQAFERAKANAPDVMITDFMMPGISGLDLLRLLRGEPGLQRVPVVMLTAKADAAHRVEALREGAVDYLLKPFDASELLARVANILQARPSR